MALARSSGSFVPTACSSTSRAAAGSSLGAASGGIGPTLSRGAVSPTTDCRFVDQT